MAALDLVGVRKQFGSADVIRGVDLAVRDGEFMVFVGPSGCGKSTLLRLVAGLDQPTEGDIRLGGRSIVGRHPADRGVAMVFQSYALYPSMTVAENIGFALKVSGMPAKERLGRVQEVAQMLRLEPLLDRLPRQLSGGQRQRVAIGRAIVRQPELFLFDEPLSNLDAELRTSTRVELAALHRRLGTTMVYVTHDQVEAMTLGDRIAVFNQGRIEQVGAPMDLYLKPATEFVAGFIGSPRMNLLDADALRQWLAKTPAGADAPWARGLHLPARTRRVGIRPDHVRLADGADGLPARMIHVERLGDCCILHLRVEGLSDALVAKVGPQLPPAVAGEPEVCVSFDPEGLHAFDETGRRIDAAA